MSNSLFFYLSLLAFCGACQGKGDNDYTVLTSEAIREVNTRVGFTDTAESWANKTDNEAEAVLEGVNIIFSVISDPAQLKVALNNDVEDKFVDLKTILKVVVITVGGNGAPLLKLVKSLVEQDYSNFEIYYGLNYTSPMPMNTGHDYKYCQKLLAELHQLNSTTPDTKPVRVHRYIPDRLLNFGVNAHESTMLAKEALDMAFYFVNPIPTVRALPEKEMKNGCIIFDGITGTGTLTPTEENLVKLDVAVRLTKEMAGIKYRQNDRVIMICNDSPSGMNQNGEWILTWGSADPFKSPVVYRVDFILSMHWNKPFVNNKEFDNTTIILLKYTFEGVSFFDALAGHPTLQLQIMDPASGVREILTGLSKDLTILKQLTSSAQNPKAFRMCRGVNPGDSQFLSMQEV